VIGDGRVNILAHFLSGGANAVAGYSVRLKRGPCSNNDGFPTMVVKVLVCAAAMRTGRQESVVQHEKLLK